MDDSGDEGETFATWIAPLDDERVRKHLAVQRSGRIGSVKHAAAEGCRGEILVELDHDDELTPDALQRIVDAFRRHPDAGLAFGEAAEVYEETLDSHWYGWDAGFGFLSYWRQYDPMTGRLLNVPRTPGTNWRTIRHLIGLPNHPRAWTRAAYIAAGRHRLGLSVADDYDLLVRSLLCTRVVRIPELLYLQYRNAGGDNQTFTRNKQIQILCGQLERYYRARLETRLRQWGLPSLDSEPYRRIWTCPEEDPRWATAEVCDRGDPERVSHLLVLPFGGSETGGARLRELLSDCANQGWRGREMVVVGQVPENLLEETARHAPPGRVRWWTTEATWPVADIVRYGRLLCSGNIQEEIVLDDVRVPATRPPLQDLDAYRWTAPADRGRDRLSVLLHLRDRYGYQRYLISKSRLGTRGAHPWQGQRR